MDWDTTEWMSHGGPDESARREIMTLLEGALDGDRAGVSLRREEGRLRMTYQLGVFLLEHSD